jgi:hypothetical protein
MSFVSMEDEYAYISWVVHTESLVNLARSLLSATTAFAERFLRAAVLSDWLNGAEMILYEKSELDVTRLSIEAFIAAFSSANASEWLKLFVSHGFKGVVYSSTGQKPLLFYLVTWRFKDCLRAAEFLMNNGANVNCAERDGTTLLHYAVRQADANSLVRLMLKLGADPNARDARGCTPLSDEQCDASNVFSLLVHGATFPLGSHLPWWVAREFETLLQMVTGERKCSPELALERWRVVRPRALAICIAMHELGLPALPMVRIIKRSFVYSNLFKFHWMWNLVVAVKHFHDRPGPSTST